MHSNQGSKFDFRCPGSLNYPQGLWPIGRGWEWNFAWEVNSSGSESIEPHQDPCKVQSPTVLEHREDLALFSSSLLPPKRSCHRAGAFKQGWVETGQPDPLFSPSLKDRNRDWLGPFFHAAWWTHIPAQERKNTSLLGWPGTQHTPSNSQPHALLDSFKHRCLKTSCWDSKAGRKCSVES